ncbi:MAG: hypothetical protein OXU86_07445 [Thaumarchaeota archaeon]|nr:hypothetical protein [Nitrososphaerota archaeon]MDD9812933.1 hypothetical protein [Nitrososphaerota archaeon]MDD9826583.1 hypothetical protein [Nitrososphaerota archaeon]MDD9842606.1 hypothetical protein [Nitrososphaerota archaeon]
MAGLGEIGRPIAGLLRRAVPTMGYDIDARRMRRADRPDGADCSILHVCIPFTPSFADDVRGLARRFSPECVAVHSTVSPNTTRSLQASMRVPVIYSATTGVHRRMTYDLKRYTKFYAIERAAPRREWAARLYARTVRRAGMRPRRMSTPVTLELAKVLCDTSYYGWLINYAQLTNLIAREHGVDYDEMWEYAAPIHRFLGNRPKMFPGYIGGHCVIPNLALVGDRRIAQVKEINDAYLKRIPNARAINRKYEGKIRRSRDS